MVSTNFLVSKLKRDENLKRRKSISEEEDSNMLNQSKVNNYGSFLSNKQNIHFIDSENENDYSVRRKKSSIVFPDMSQRPRKGSLKQQSARHISPQILLGLEDTKSHEIPLSVLDFKIENVNNYQMKIKNDRAGSFSEQMDQAMTFLHGRHLSRFDDWKDRFAESIESNIRKFKEEIFLTSLKRFRASTVHELEQLETPKSVFFHEFRHRQHSIGPDSLQNAIHRFSQKVHAETSTPELKMDFHEILSIVHSQRKEMQKAREIENVRKKLGFGGGMNFEKGISVVDEKAEKRKMLEGCIRLLSQQLKEL